MRTVKLKKTVFLVSLIVLFCGNVNSETKKNSLNEHQINFYGGVFDFSDDKQKAGLFGIQHQNENLKRETFLGNVSPVTGVFLTENSAVYFYSGVEWNFDLGGINFTPSFTPGLYEQGDGKDLGHVVEFKSEVQATYNISDKSSIAVSYTHLTLPTKRIV